MKRILILVLILAGLIAGGYTGGAWWIGKQVERGANEKFASLQKTLPPWLTIKHDFQRGLFKSEETDTLNICMPPCAQPTQLTIQTHIKQLPLPGLIHHELVSADSELQFDPAAAAAWTGGKPLANLHSTFLFDGSGNLTYSMPAINSSRMTTVAGQLQVNFTKDMASYTQQGNLPSFTLHTKQPGLDMVLSDLQVSGTHNLITPYKHLYGGNDHVQFARIGDSNGRIVQIKHLTLDDSVSSSGNGLVDMKVNYGVEGLAVTGQEYGPAHFDISLHHLDGATLDNMSQENMDVRSNPVQVIAGMKTLLMRDPEISVDRLSFNVPAGEALVTADIKAEGVTQSDFANPLAIVGKVLAVADIKLPESLAVAALAPSSPKPGEPAQNPGLGLDALVKAGYLTRSLGFVSTHIELSGGKLTLNGKPINLLPLLSRMGQPGNPPT